MRLRSRIHLWFLTNSRRIEVLLLLANVIGLPIFALLAWELGWMSSVPSGHSECGSGRYTWGC